MPGQRFDFFSSCKVAMHMFGMLFCHVTDHLLHAGLMGGHSGLNINEDRGNAVRFVAQIVNAVLSAAPTARLASITGGDKRNAIAREASAMVLVSGYHSQALFAPDPYAVLVHAVM